VAVLAAYADEHGFLRAWCIHCRRWHYHGQGEGHRVAHCSKPDSPYERTGYILQHVGEWHGERKTPKGGPLS
jgi:hypothetical protein